VLPEIFHLEDQLTRLDPQRPDSGPGVPPRPEQPDPTRPDVEKRT
jgi:hypothetical protein